jgi:hypothetical protein
MAITHIALQFIIKVKVLRNRLEGPEGVRGIPLPFLDLGVRRGWVVSTTTQLFTPGRHGTHCTGGWVGPRAGLDVCEKSRLPPGFDPRTVQTMAVAIPTELSRLLYSSLYCT